MQSSARLGLAPPGRWPSLIELWRVAFPMQPLAAHFLLLEPEHLQDELAFARPRFASGHYSHHLVPHLERNALRQIELVKMVDFVEVPVDRRPHERGIANLTSDHMAGVH